MRGSRVNDRQKHQVQIALLQTQQLHSSGRKIDRKDSLRQSNQTSGQCSVEEMDNVLRLSRENEQLLQQMMR